jgi:hypothetical protein
MLPGTNVWAPPDINHVSSLTLKINDIKKQNKRE